MEKVNEPFHENETNFALTALASLERHGAFGGDQESIRLTKSSLLITERYDEHRQQVFCIHFAHPTVWYPE
ncbi:hypothetical protein [Paracidovorax valerianellae]|uniref:hypothetical protein n=1 Tax=Paracidovorax valerianellae TaxID=187868 RepID=UPI0015879295|nr:hypothetical protein [Paracidovorax valerianellae]MDA8447452.1 hypothetical protein [Paracidovorax valerianellae]